MKNLLIALTLFVSLVVFGSFVVTRSIEAQTNDLLPRLLELPAPAPPNPLAPKDGSERPEEFYSKKNPPADNAPIEDLLEYWKRQSGQYQDLRYTPELSDRSLDRLLAEIEKNPASAAELVNVLPNKPEVVEAMKRIYDQQTANATENDGTGTSDGEGTFDDSSQMRGWLRANSPYFSDELVDAANAVGDTSVGYVSNQEAMLALVRADWNKAKPILDRLYNDSSQPVSQTLARWALYRHALDTDSFGDIDRYREELQKDVENKSLSNGNRDLAMDALTKEKGWSGRDDWYFSLLEDETLADLRVGGTSYTGLTTLMLMSAPDKYTDRMIALLKSGNKTIRSAAVRNLGTMIDDKNAEVVKALLPWLENKDWAVEYGGERQRLVAALANFEIPESVPGLVALLDEKETREIADYSSMSNMATMNTNMMTNRLANMAAVKTKTVDYYPFRSGAIQALVKQKSPQAVPALRRMLQLVQPYERSTIVRAIYQSNGFTIPEQITALEAAAQGVKDEIKSEVIARQERLSKKETDNEAVVTEETVSVPNGYGGANNVYNTDEPPPPPMMTAEEMKEMLGQQIISTPEPPPELLAAIVQRINVLDKTDRSLADALRRIMLGWQGAAVNAILLSDVKNGKADINAMLRLLSIRKELREKQINDVYVLRSGGTSIALGLSACLLETQSDFDALLISENLEAKTAMFGCARLIRARLPVNIVAQNLSSQNKLLALAAEEYLEAEDSPQARAVILAKYPNQAKILGATTHFGNSEGVTGNQFIGAVFRSVNNLSWFDDYYLDNSEYQDIEKTEKKLQKEIVESSDLLGVYSYDKNFVRIYRDRVMYSFAEDDSRYRERYLTPAEFDNLKNYLVENRVDEQLPYLSVCGEESCSDKELLMLGRQGGRRVYSRGYDASEFFKGLDKMFEEMQKAPAKLRYELEKSVTGLEILFADENLKAQTIWKNGNDLRVLVADTNLRKQIDEDLDKQDVRDQENDNPDYEKLGKISSERRAQRAYDHYSWRRLTNENASEMTAPPETFNFPPARDGFIVRSSIRNWKAKTANFEIRADETGLYKITGGRVQKILQGNYENAVITPDGRWLVVNKFDPEEGNRLVRVNLLNNREFKIEYEGYAQYEPAAAVPSGKQVLIRYIPYAEEYESESESEKSEITANNEFIYILDVETGKMVEAKGDIYPLASQTFRPLQKVSNLPDAFWAAESGKNGTDIGIYNSKTLSFKASMTIPSISFDSMSMWVDEAENKVYFVYKGQLLALSLPKK